MKLYSALIGLSLIWGISFVFIETITAIAGVWGTVLLRCLAGAIILLPILFIKYKKKEIAINGLPWKALVIAGIFNAGIPWGLIALSQTEITSNTAAVLNAMTPILTGLIGFMFFSTILKQMAMEWYFPRICGDYNINELQHK